MWRIYNRDLDFIIIFSETDEQSKTLLGDIRKEMETNNRLRATYGDFVESSTETKLTTVNDQIIRSAGRGTNSRGWKHHGNRPDLIIGDDIENDETVNTTYQRNKVENWWDGAVTPMSGGVEDESSLEEDMRVILVGTILHQDSLLSRKIKSGAFRVFFRRAILNEPKHSDMWDKWGMIWKLKGKKKAMDYYKDNEKKMNQGAEVLWPKKYPLIILKQKARKMGSFKFQTEYQNDPVPIESVVINPEWITDRPKLIDNTIVDGKETIDLEDLTTVSAVDVAISEKESGDYFVITTGGRHESGNIYIWDIIRTKISAPKQIKLIIETYLRWNPESVLIESVSYQKALKQMVDEVSAKNGVYVPTKAVTPDKDKVRRLRRWQSIHEQGLVKYCDSVSSSCIDEITQFPLAENDDVPDTVSYFLSEVAGTNKTVRFAYI